MTHLTACGFCEDGTYDLLRNGKRGPCPYCDGTGDYSNSYWNPTGRAPSAAQAAAERSTAASSSEAAVTTEKATTRSRRGPSGRFPTYVADARLSPAETVAAARTAEGGRDVEPVVWVHESVHDAWALPTSPGGHAERFPDAREIGNSGWLLCGGSPTVHVAFVRWHGDFAGCATPAELGEAVEAWRAAVGMGYAFSGPSTLHALIRSTLRGIGDAPAEPELTGWRGSAWAVPTNTWGVAADTFAWLAGRAGWVRCFDRSGSYLAAWSGLRLGTDTWGPIPSPGFVGRAGAGESSLPVGYWLVYRHELPDAGGLFDPFRRHGHDAPTRAPVWLTTPLLQLALDLRGEPVPYIAGWENYPIARPLDVAAQRLRAARDQLAGPALAALKVAYAGATAWFEHGPDSGPLARPYWRRAIIDRAVANTYRALARCQPWPIALADIDTALVCMPDADVMPDGLRLGTGLGQWKPKGPALPAADAAAAYLAGGPRAVVKLAETRHG